MRACVQRVNSASVMVDGLLIGQIGPGLLVLLGVATEDCESDARELAEKIVNLRIFEDDAGKMNRSLLETGGALLVVSQFTLLGDCRKGRRPSFIAAAPPEAATGTLASPKRFHFSSLNRNTPPEEKPTRPFRSRSYDNPAWPETNSLGIVARSFQRLVTASKPPRPKVWSMSRHWFVFESRSVFAGKVVVET